MKLYRIQAYTARYLYLYKRSLPRLMEVFYWPLVDLFVWGFITVYLSAYKGALPDFVGFFIGALILWDMLFRCQQGITVSFLEDMWSRNLLNIFVSPLSPAEYVCSLLVMSVIKLLLASSVMVLVAWGLYSFNVFQMGFALVPFAINLLMMGWAVGIITTAVIMRFGQETEVLAWGIAFLFQPFSAVFYPVGVLPPVMRKIAFYIPSSHVFEGMRSVIAGKPFPTDEVLVAALLNAVYLAIAVVFFIWTFKSVKRKGLLVKIGE
ncbi:MAG TPA: ABC transporter permease [Thermodesulfobacteriota bacterium]|nr:ABC transporter permease [Thermodesulfobacteriota bacterium]